MTKRRFFTKPVLAAATLLSLFVFHPVMAQSLSKLPGTNLPDGLRIIDTKAGIGASVTAGATVVVNYVGYLDADGEKGDKFDASADHSADGFTFTLGTHSVIAGWDEGVLGMKVGGKRMLIVPPDLAYAGKQAGKIPPWSTLVFDIELREIK